MRWVEIAVRTTAMAEEAVANALMEAGCGGVAIDDPSAFSQKSDVDETGIIYPKSGDVADVEGSLIRICGYLPMDDSFEQKLEEARVRIDGLSEFGLDTDTAEITIRPVDEEDWATAWKAYFKPFKIGNIVIKPSWEEYDARADEIILELDPGMAFGTGTHPTTHLCILALQEYVSGHGNILDLGCGSGILAMAAAKLGAKRIIAVDIDSVATEAAARNVAAAGLADVIEVRLGDAPVSEQFDLVLANIIANTIIRLAEQLKDSMRPGGLLISSGIISEREKEVRDKLESLGLETVEAMHSGEWVAFVSRRPID